MQAKEGLEMAIKSKMNTYLTARFSEARSISWSPKLPYCAQAGAFDTHSSHLDEVTTYI